MKKLSNLLVLTTLFLLLTPLVSCSKTQEKLLNEYNIDLVLNEDMTIDMAVEFTFYNNLQEGLSSLKFNLYPNAFSSSSKIKPISIEYLPIAYENGMSYGEIQINEVKTGGENLNYEVCGIDNNILKVSLNAPLKKQEKIKIFIDCTILLPNILHRFGYGDNTINLTGFYPILCVFEKGDFVENLYYPYGDPFYSDCANYILSISVPSKYVVASSLNPEKTICFQDYTEYDYSQQSVREIALILSEKFNIARKVYKGIEISYYYFNDSDFEESLNVAIECIEWFSKTFKKYPYKTYAVCQADFVYGGMEYPCLTIIDKNLKGIDKNYCIAHETAHQWWYGLVGVNQIEEGYIDEGLTEYSTALFFNSHKKYNLSLENLIKNSQSSYLSIRKIIAEKTGENNPVMVKNLGEFISDLDYVSIAYYRSQIMFDRVKKYMGQSNFIKALKDIIDIYEYENVNTSKIIKVFEKRKKDAGKVIEKFISGKEAV